MNDDLCKEGPARTILIIDDNEHLRQFSAAVLERAGHIVIQAGDAREAMEIWSRDQVAISVIIADIHLPGQTGPELAREFLDEKPDLKIVFTSGSLPEVVNEATYAMKDARFLPKPYTAKVMLDAVREVLKS